MDKINQVDNSLQSQTQSTITLHKDVGDDKDRYDPFEHRNVAHPTSTVGSFFNLLKSSLGSGLLAMPVAFKHAGLIPGTIGTLLVGLIATHCVHMLVQTSRDICTQIRKPLLSYTDTCEQAFKNGPKALKKYSNHIRIFVDAAMAGVCLGGTSVYVIFVATSIKDICDSFSTVPTYRLEIYCLFLAIPLILTTQIRHLKFIVPFSILANFCLLLVFAITCYYTLTDLPPITVDKLSSRITEWPLFISTAIFAMEGINVVMPVENEMKNPKRFLGCPSVLNFTMGFVAVLYWFVGAIGYTKYGKDVKGSITLNLPEKEVLALIAKVLVAVAVFFTYCLQMYAPMEILWTRIKGQISLKYHNLSQIALRTLSVIFTVVLAVAIPDLELLIGLVGAICFSTLGLCIPIIVETVYKIDKTNSVSLLLIKNSILMLFYLFVLVTGCYTSIEAIVVKYSQTWLNTND